jgi:glycosyltransferase involved in cell wall biosynthesis
MTTGSSVTEVLLVENRAHVPRGHFPTRFLVLAEAVTELGHPVEVLTAAGWLRGRDLPNGIRMSRYGRTAGALDAAAAAVAERFWGRTGAGRVVDRGARLVRSAITLLVARARRRALGDPAVLVLSSDTSPVLTTLLAGPGSWLLYSFAPATAPRSRRAVVTRAATALAARCERARRAAGGALCVVVPDASWVENWRVRLPGVSVAVAHLSGARPRVRIEGARDRLGIHGGDRVALVFGARHAGKDVGTVCEAFRDLDGWRLLLAGGVADGDGPVPAPSDAVRMPGHLDDPECALAWSAADVAVLSFRDGFRRDSGTLVDAVAWGVPVVCSDRSSVADAVRRHRLGSVFEPGDPASLVATLRNAPLALDPDDVAAAREAYSSIAIAGALLSLLEPPVTSGRGRGQR